MQCRSCGKECIDVGFGHCKDCASGKKGSISDDVTKHVHKFKPVDFFGTTVYQCGCGAYREGNGET